MDDKVFDAAKWQKLVSDQRHQSMDPQLFINSVNPAQDERWLDVGCGPGFYTEPLARNVREVVANDISDQMLEICRRRMQEQGLKNVIYQQSAAGQIDGQAGAFDGILMANVFHEVPDRHKVLLRLKSLLAAGGRLYIIEWKAVHMQNGPPLDHRIPQQELIEIGTTAGFHLQQKHDIYDAHYVLEFRLP